MIQVYFYKEKVSLAICSFSFALVITLGFYTSCLNAKIEAIQHRLSSLNYLAVRSQEAAMIIQTHQEDFAAFESCRFERPVVPEMLQASLHHPVEFGAISSLNGLLKNKTLVAQDVSFSIPCLRDKDVFALLDQLTNQGPGFFQIHGVTITRVGPLTEEMLEKIAAGKPQALFDGRITATWIHR